MHISVYLCFVSPFKSPMGWLWLVGSIKLWVSLAKEPYRRANILQRRPIILSILLTIATPYSNPVGGSIFSKSVGFGVLA